MCRPDEPPRPPDFCLSSLKLSRQYAHTATPTFCFFPDFETALRFNAVKCVDMKLLRSAGVQFGSLPSPKSIATVLVLTTACRAGRITCCASCRTSFISLLIQPHGYDIVIISSRSARWGFAFVTRTESGRAHLHLRCFFACCCYLLALRSCYCDCCGCLKMFSCILTSRNFRNDRVHRKL